jgi:hypothetical protein
LGPGAEDAWPCTHPPVPFKILDLDFSVALHDQSPSCLLVALEKKMIGVRRREAGVASRNPWGQPALGGQL